MHNWSFLNNKDFLNYLRYNSYCSQQHKLLYIATPKVACTTIKWWFAELEGYSQILRGIDDSGETDPDLVIHDVFHKVAPNVTGLPPETLAGPLASDSYFRFAVVRNPFKRIFSAWQSKLLLREPYQVSPYITCNFFHHLIECADDIAAAFEGFLEHLVINEAPAYWDAHWTPQVDLLRPDLINYSILAKIENTEELSQALTERIGGHLPGPFASRRTNESLIPYLPELVTQRSAEMICLLYAEDFETFGYDKQPPEAKETFSSDQFKLAFKAIAFIRGRHQRMGERNNQVARLKQAMVEYDEQLSRFVQMISDRDGQIFNLNQALADFNTELSAYQTQADKFAQNVFTLQENLAAAQTEIIRRDEELAKYKNQAEEFTKNVCTLQENLATAHAEIVNKDIELAKYKNQAEEFTKNVCTLQENLVATRAEIVSKDNKLVKYKNQVEEFTRNVFSLQENIADAQTEIAHKDEQIAKYNNKNKEFAQIICTLQEKDIATQIEIAMLASNLYKTQIQQELDLSDWKFLAKHMALIIRKILQLQPTNKRS